MVDYDALEIYYGKITDKCLEWFHKDGSINLWDMATDLMRIEGLPMHCPPHHYLMPAVLLTACHKAEDGDEEILKEDLEEACSRAHNILGGFCGLYGNCGAAVGAGIFFSIYTQTGPCSEESWSWANKIVAEGLMRISEIEGPRCCKRNIYLALEAARDVIEEYLEIYFEKPEKVVCQFYKNNKECKGIKCPYFSKEGGRD